MENNEQNITARFVDVTPNSVRISPPVRGRIVDVTEVAAHIEVPPLDRTSTGVHVTANATATSFRVPTFTVHRDRPAVPAGVTPATTTAPTDEEHTRDLLSRLNSMAEAAANASQRRALDLRPGRANMTVSGSSSALDGMKAVKTTMANTNATKKSVAVLGARKDKENLVGGTKTKTKRVAEPKPVISRGLRRLTVRG